METMINEDEIGILFPAVDTRTEMLAASPRMCKPFTWVGTILRIVTVSAFGAETKITYYTQPRRFAKLFLKIHLYSATLMTP